VVDDNYRCDQPDHGQSDIEKAVNSSERHQGQFRRLRVAAATTVGDRQRLCWIDAEVDVIIINRTRPQQRRGAGGGTPRS
jgi:hypothetical protein